MSLGLPSAIVSPKSSTTIRCDTFISEATFGLPVFRHPPDRHEIDRLLHSLRLFPERCQLVGVYALGKCQRVIGLLRVKEKQAA